MSVENIQSLLIVGGGVEGWMSAAYLARVLGPSVTISLLDQEPAAAPIGCATLPPIKALHATLGLAEADILKRSDATMKLGTQFVNWGHLGNRYFHAHGGPQGGYAPDFDLVPLYQWWLKARGEGVGVGDFDDYSFGWRLAREGRFVHPDPDRRLIQSTHDYAYHLDMNLYADILKKQAIGHGVRVKFGEILEVRQHHETGDVEAVVLRDGENLQADLYLDCSGKLAVLANAVLMPPLRIGHHSCPMIAPFASRARRVLS
ncbi:MAG: tryptophan 7-halogenase [Hyphomonadaceae bacterium]|nr:tryptophan 7-halogenase [Hyphomonadaceae bacterium]